MKSEKAKEYITHATCTAQEYAERFGGRELVVSRWDVSTAIELAEQDAEMRMREKAIKAYCSECACYEGGLRIRPRQMCDKTTFCPKHDRGMKSQKAKEFIDGCMAHLTVEMSDHAKWQLRAAMTHAAELAEQEMEGFYTCWIDPKDFMPEANKNVLVKCSSGEIQTDFYAPELGGFFIEHSTHAKVTGWREMM